MRSVLSLLLLLSPVSALRLLPRSGPEAGAAKFLDRFRRQAPVADDEPAGPAGPARRTLGVAAIGALAALGGSPVRASAEPTEYYVMDQLASFAPKKSPFRVGKFWLLRKPWSERKFEDKFSKVPVFIITNAKGDPYFSPTPDGESQIGRFYIDPRDAQDVLDEFLQEPATSEARLSITSMARALEIVADSSKQNRKKAVVDFPELRKPDDLTAEQQNEEMRRMLNQVHASMLAESEEMDVMHQEDAYLYWEVVGSQRASADLQNVMGARDVQRRSAKAQRAAVALPPSLVLGAEGLLVKKCGEMVTPLFFCLEDLEAAWEAMVERLPEGQRPGPPVISTYDLNDVLQLMAEAEDDKDGVQQISLQPMREARRFIQRVKRDKSTKAVLNVPADVIGRRGG